MRRWLKRLGLALLALVVLVILGIPVWEFESFLGATCNALEQAPTTRLDRGGTQRACESLCRWPCLISFTSRRNQHCFRNV